MAKRVQLFFSKPSLTKQEFKNECDLGMTIRRFGKTPEGQRALQNTQGFAEGAQFGDVSAVPDFRSARDAVNAANASFMALPAILRKRFDNDPAFFLDFVSNPDNRSEMISLGLIKSAPQDAAKTQVLEGGT